MTVVQLWRSVSHLADSTGSEPTPRKSRSSSGAVLDTPAVATKPTRRNVTPAKLKRLATSFPAALTHRASNGRRSLDRTKSSAQINLTGNPVSDARDDRCGQTPKRNRSATPNRLKKLATNLPVMHPKSQHPFKFKSPEIETSDLRSVLSTRGPRLEKFHQFLLLEFSEENLEFWLCCDIYRNTDTELNRNYLARHILQTFVSEDCKKEVNLDCETRCNIESAVASDNFSLDLFEAAQTHIFRLMETDCYPRYLKSQTREEEPKRKSRRTSLWGRKLLKH